MKKHNRHNTITSKSIRIKLEEQGLINNQLLTLISGTSLEDLIALKLELSCNEVNERLFGFDIWRNLKPIVPVSYTHLTLPTIYSV